MADEGSQRERGNERVGGWRLEVVVMMKVIKGVSMRRFQERTSPSIQSQAVSLFQTLLP
jgi:hypothetical protein